MNLLFDLDGTLTDPFPGITKSILHALNRLGRALPSEENLRWCIGPPLKNSFAQLLDTDDDALTEKAVAYYRERFGTVGLFENEVYESIPETLENLRKSGHTLYVATSKPSVFATRIIDHFGLKRYFKAVHGSELDGTRCDKTELLEHILQEEGITSTDTVMIGDRKHDIVGAKANGIRGIGVLWGYGTKNELEAAGANVCIEQPGELMAEFQ